MGNEEKDLKIPFKVELEKANEGKEYRNNLNEDDPKEGGKEVIRNREQNDTTKN